ncbi:MAG: hypothetical protein ABS63_08625 [Microbacterium sp. SCN 70-27]|nr:MAG: hypothetical protein ABS63_08625 [Microbacterium sp. SCN 70-27]
MRDAFREVWDQYDVRMPYEPIVPEGQHLGTSREHDGAVTGHLFDEDNNLKGHAAWQWVDEPEESYSPVYVESPTRELTPEERELIEQATALLLALIIIGVQAAAPRVRRWWNQTALPVIRRAWQRATRRNAQPDVVVEAEMVELLEVIEAEITPTPEPGSELVADPQFTMSSAEWATRYRAMVAAAAFQDEQARILKSAHVVDEFNELGAEGDAELTPRAFAEHVRSMLAANPDLLTDESVAELQHILEKRVQKLGRSTQ